MADFDNRVLRGQTGAVTDVVDQGLRAYMLRVYNYMLVGLVLTGLLAYGTTMLTTTTDPSAAAAAMRNGVMLTSFGVTLYTSPLHWPKVLEICAIKEEDSEPDAMIAEPPPTSVSSLASIATASAPA